MDVMDWKTILFELELLRFRPRALTNVLVRDAVVSAAPMRRSAWHGPELAAYTASNWQDYKARLREEGCGHHCKIEGAS